MTVHVELSTRANRVNVDLGQILPLHGTASGIAFLSRARADILKACLEGPMEAYTPFTVTSRTQLEEAANQARSRGYSRSDQGFEEGVSSVAAPILNADGFAIGTLAIASPLSRVDTDTCERHGQMAMRVAADISSRLNGEPTALQNERAS